MKKLYLTLIIATLLIGIVFAGELITSQFTKTISMDKEQRDYLLTKAVFDQSKGEVKEIKPTINIECSAKECKYSAVQEGIISSYDNIINREYCSKYNYTYDEKLQEIIGDGGCIEYSIYNLIEMQDQVSNLVAKRLTDYANRSLSEDKTIVEVSTGIISITEK